MSTFTKMQPNSGEKRRHESKRSLNLRRLLNVKSLLQLPFCKTFFSDYCLACSHYSKSKIFVQKIIFDNTLQFFSGIQSCQQLKSANLQHFHEFFTQNFFWQIFSWNQSCRQLKSQKPQHFHEFSPKTIRQFFSENQSWFFGQKWRFWTVCLLGLLALFLVSRDQFY